ncbi:MULTISPECIES: response regulator [Luteimonas]|uniref:response regulator n=1 Tax=Luteimonas TaxID=83614 RepID=UPI001E605C10|nr:MULTISPECIES: response regulator [Luteimonas]
MDAGGALPPRRRVLIVDDSRDDAELTELALRDAGLHIECQRVHGEAGLTAALRDFVPEIVLSDINLPGYSGAEALALTRAVLPAVPLVFLTGTLDTLDDALPVAEGLVLKDDLDAELPPLVRRLLA